MKEHPTISSEILALLNNTLYGVNNIEVDLSNLINSHIITFTAATATSDLTYHGIDIAYIADKTPSELRDALYYFTMPIKIIIKHHKADTGYTTNGTDIYAMPQTYTGDVSKNILLRYHLGTYPISVNVNTIQQNDGFFMNTDHNEPYVGNSQYPYVFRVPGYELLDDTIGYQTTPFAFSQNDYWRIATPPR